ncbi:MAG: LPS export ABC transporter permease LptF [Nitrospirota bacterium]
MLIHRTIFKELFINFMTVILSLSVILFMERFVRLTRVFMGKGTEVIDIAKVFIYLQPSILLLSLPMATLIAIFLTYGRMAADSEIVVLKGSGMSFSQISGAALMLSTAGFCVILFISLYLSPLSMQYFKRTLHETITKKASMIMEEETFTEVFKDTVVYIKNIASKNRFKGIFIYRDSGASLKDPVVIVAEDGALISNPKEGMIKLLLNKGIIHTTSQKSASEISFSKYDFVLTTGIERSEDTRSDEIALFDLWKGRKDKVLWDIELNRRFAIPFACLIFGILGPALSSRMGKMGRLGGFSFSLSLLIFYYVMLIIAEGLAKAGKVTPFWSIWTPNMIFGAIAVLFFRLSHQDSPAKRI